MGITRWGARRAGAAAFLDRRDYCKLHIVSHYVRRLLGPGFPVIPLGMVGADEVGERLLGEMGEVGLDLRYVGRAESLALPRYATCRIYPDGSGGNVTENDSACVAVDAGWINRAENEFARFAGAGIALALPEVPLQAPAKSCWRWARRTASCASHPSPLPNSSSWPAGSTRLTSWR